MPPHLEKGRFFRKKAKWGGSHSPSQISLPSIQLSDIIEFSIKPNHLNADFLQQKYTIEGLSCEEISRSIGSARSTVLKYLKKFNIPIRETGANIRRKRGLAYGQKVVGRNEEIHKREVENIKKMRELRDKGYSYWKIAEVFNTLKIPTKTKRGRWHAKSVYQIIGGHSGQSVENE